MDHIINVFLLQIQNNNSQGIADAIAFLYQTYMDSFYKASHVIEHRKELNLIWKHVKAHGNMVLVEGVRVPLRSLVKTHLQPFLDGANDVEAYIRNFVTRQFLLFIQGITLFRDDGDDVIGDALGRPAYHRNASCGPDNANKQYKLENLSCLGVHDADELRRRMRNIWNCHLERNIYNEMYVKYFGEQNAGHVFQKHHVERELFESCFHLGSISLLTIRISKWDNNIPVQLAIVYMKKSDGVAFDIVTEKYTRKHKDGLYTADVYCERVVAYPNGSNRSWSKVSTFYKKNNDWVAMHNAPPFGADPWAQSAIKYRTKLVLKW